MYCEKNNNSAKVQNKNISSWNKDQNHRWKVDLRDWILLVPSLLAFACYVNGLHGDFVHDDIFAIKSNRDVLGTSDVSGVWWNDFWGKPMASNTSHKSYRPVTVLTFRWNYLATGDDPFYFHVVNVALHVVVTSLLVLTCRDVFAMSQHVSVIAGATFAVHPIHTEAVTGIVGRADVLSALFFLLSFLAYVRSLSSAPRDFPHTESPGLFVLSLLLAAVAMLCKETGVTVLAVTLIYDMGVVCRRGVARMVEDGCRPRSDCAPLIRRIFTVGSFTCGLLAIRLWLIGGTLPDFVYGDNPASFHASLLVRYMSYGFVWAYNCWLLIMPSNLCYDWQNGSIPLVETIVDPRNLATLIVLLVFATATYKVYKNFKVDRDQEWPSCADPVLVVLMFTIIPFLPASNVFFRVGFVLAERVLYIPSMGFCIAVAVGFCHVLEWWPHRRRLGLAVLCSLLLMHAGKTWRRNEDWRSREAIFRSGINSMPHNAKVHYNYGNLLKDTERTIEAVRHYREAIRLDPHYPSAYNNLGTLLEDREERLWYFTRALHLKPDHVAAHINMGHLHLELGNSSESIRYLYRAVELDDRAPDPLLALALALQQVGAEGRAEIYLRRVLTAYPDHVHARLQYGGLLNRLGRHDEAAGQYKAAYDLDGTKTKALVYAAQSLEQIGDVTQAETLLQRAVAVHRDVVTLEQLAMMYFSRGRHAESHSLFEEARRAADNSSDVLVRQAKMFSNARQTDRAEALLSQVLQRHPEHVDALVTMAAVTCSAQRHAQGIELFNRAISECERTGTPVPEAALFERGNCYREDGQLQRALQDFLAVLSSNPDHSGAHVNAGTIFHMWANIEQAGYHYHEALRVDPNHRVARDNLLKLNRMLGHRSQGVG